MSNDQNPELNKTSDSSIKEQNITGELKKSYINYAMSVIVARALPDVRDGLKPVQRRILFTMHKMNIQPGSAYKKVARIVGEVMGKYHPHGDAAISDALVRMGQEFSMRYMLIDGQGNFGSVDGDPPAAMRYIEARLDKHGAEILKDLEQKTVDFYPNYDGNETQPEVLPAAFPNLLLNGTEGIAVGMATKIPPHNLTELADSIINIISYKNTWFENNEQFEKIDYDTVIKRVEDIDKLDKKRFYKFEVAEDIKEIMKFIKGPDFPTGAEIYDKKEIDQIYLTGKGRVLMRAVSSIEESKPGRFQIIITELPYQVNKANLIAKISQLYRDKKIVGITDLRDESSSKEGIRITIDLKRDAQPKAVQNQLYKYTEMQKNFNANMLALVDGEPQLLNFKQILQYFISHRQEIVIRRHEFELAKLREREHILEGLLIALDNIDEIIQTIRNSKDVDTARTELMKKFELSEIQAQAILDMQLRRLAALEAQKIQDEYNQVVARIKEVLIILNTPEKVIEIIQEEVEALKSKFGDERRSKLHKGKVGEISDEDIIASEDTIVTISEQGYIKRVKDDSYQIQKRGGVGKKAMSTKNDDSVRHIFKCNTHDQILFFTNRGKVYSLKVYEIPEYSRTAKGLPVVNLIQVENDELVTSVLTRKGDGQIIDEDIAQEGEEDVVKKKNKFLFMATKKGNVKKTELTEYTNIRSNGLIAIGLDAEDELIWVKPTSGENTIMLVSNHGKSITFDESDVRKMGRPAKGVRGIRLKSEDFVIAMDVLREKEVYVLTISEKGYGKLSEITQFNKQNRGGSGIFAARVNDKTGKLVVARLLDHPEKELLILSENNNAIKIPTNNLPIQNRQTAGVKLIRLKTGDKVATAAIV